MLTNSLDKQKNNLRVRKNVHCVLHAPMRTIQIIVSWLCIIFAMNITEQVPDETATIHIPSDNINILTFFFAHDFTRGMVITYNWIFTGEERLLMLHLSPLSLVRIRMLVCRIACSLQKWLRFISPFYRKGKTMCWKAMLKRQEFIDAFEERGIYVEKNLLLNVLKSSPPFFMDFPKQQSVSIALAKFFRKSFT